MKKNTNNINNTPPLRKPEQASLLLTGAYNYTTEQLSILTGLGFNIVFVQDERLPLDIDVSTIDAVVCNSLFLANDISKFHHLRFIQLTSAGNDRVPMEYITANGIRLKTATGVYSVPMAEWVILKILEIYKKSFRFYEAQKNHQWRKQRDLLEMTGKTAAIVGYGSVGMEVAKRLRAFDVQVIAVDSRTLNPEEMQGINELQSPEKLNDVLKRSDMVILTLPLNQQTRHLINAENLSLMKENSVLVNISRGGVIDEKALITTAQNGKFLGIALDVFEEEPLNENNPLWDINNVFITPHNSFVSDLIQMRLFDLIYKNLRQFV